MLSEKTDPIVVKHSADCLRRISASREHVGEFLHISDCLNFGWTLLRSVTTVQIGADGHMRMRARELANVINMICQFLKRCFGTRCFARGPSRSDHPVIKWNANHRLALNQQSQLLVGKLSYTWHKS